LVYFILSSLSPSLYICPSFFHSHISFIYFLRSPSSSTSQPPTKH
jgi:hypothetical protein